MNKKSGPDVDALLKEVAAFDNPVSEKHKSILEAAALVFGEKGYEAAPTAEIARRAGVTERTLFKHFKTKADLVKRVVFAFAVKVFVPAQVKEVMAIAQANHESYKSFMKALAMNRLALVQAQGFGPKIVLGEVLKNEDFREMLKGIFRENAWPTLLEAVKRFQAEGKVRSDLPAEVIARSTLLNIAGYVAFRGLLTPNEKWDDEKTIDEICSVVCDGVQPR